MLPTINAGYVGVQLDDVDTQGKEPAVSVRSQLSDISLLKHRTRRYSKTAASSISSQARRVLSKDFAKHSVYRSRTFFGEAFEDLQSLVGPSGWRHFLWRVFTLCGPVLIICGVCAILPFISSPKLFGVSEVCQPDSGFYIGFDEYDIWNVSGFFQITLGFGKFSFSTAKIIDVGWDIVIGRGGQALLAGISFIIFSKALVRSMESSPVSYGTFEAVTLQNSSLTATFKLARDLLKNKTARAKALVSWMILNVLFVLIYPTILSAMTGYSVNIGAFIEVDNGNMVVYKNFTLVRYVVHDAYRINEALGTDYLITTRGREDGSEEITQLQDYEFTDSCLASAFPRQNTSGFMDWSYTTIDPMCNLYWHVSEYGFRYGFLGEHQGTSTFNYSGTLVNLTQPSLNISAIFWEELWITGDSSNGTDWFLWPYGYNWKDSTGQKPFHNFSDPIFTNGQYTYDLADLNARGRCQQEGITYKWGFSFLVLFSFTVMFLVWCIGMYVIWLDAFLYSRFDRVGRSMGLQRAVLDLAYCMHKDVDEAGRDMLSNGDLQSTIRRDLRGGRITYEMLDPKLLPLSRAEELRMRRADWRQQSRKTDKKEWLKRHRWSLAFFVGSLGFLAAALAGTHTPLITAFLLPCGFINVFLISESHKGRWLIFLVYVALAVVFAPIGPYVYLDKSHYTVIWLRANAYESIEWWMNQ